MDERDEVRIERRRTTLNDAEVVAPDDAFGGAIRSAAPPNVMWPDENEGFEPSRYSPAGEAMLGWHVVQSARRNRMAALFLVSPILIGLGLTAAAVALGVALTL